ncbi:hypothetical protein [Knoellia subterranea]|uniref:Uncharacterized protein n=1 Tax=Knoellia subterranea KCTC 19937 TaxID=1385521 RepID=A0A0A0JHP9_9MICO|nr:hypothetical protein [Knoellia subterranea]KGN35552.1 hypothetical protein N803_06470 [Knoellia subterranea KCTC 19937]
MIADLEQALEKQRLTEWRTYGEALKAKIEQLAAETPGLNVPVHLTVDPDTFRPDPSRSGWEEDSLEARLLSTALEQTPTPLALPGTPLERLLGAGTA